MRRKRIISLVLSACLIVGSAVQGGAATTQEKISDAKAQQQENQSSLQQTQEKIQELESKKGESETYLADLNTQLDDLRSSLEKLQNDYDAKQEELTQLQSDLEDAKADEAQQYEAMKLRIRYMYENSASNYMNLLFESGSISDFLNQAENISQMSKYDRDMLDTYRETKEAIQTKEEQVAQEKEEIVALQQESADKQAAVEELVEATYQQIREYQEDIQSQQTAENDLLTKISSQEDAINDLLRQAKEEEAAARLAAQQAAQAAAEKAAQEAAAKEAADKKAAEDAAAQKAAQQKAAQQAASATQKKSNSSTTTTTTTSNTAANTTTSTTTTDSSDDTIDTSQGKYGKIQTDSILRLFHLLRKMVRRRYSQRNHSDTGTYHRDGGSSIRNQTFHQRSDLYRRRQRNRIRTCGHLHGKPQPGIELWYEICRCVSGELEKNKNRECRIRETYLHSLFSLTGDCFPVHNPASDCIECR